MKKINYKILAVVIGVCVLAAVTALPGCGKNENVEESSTAEIEITTEAEIETATEKETEETTEVETVETEVAIEETVVQETSIADNDDVMTNTSVSTNTDVSTNNTANTGNSVTTNKDVPSNSGSGTNVVNSGQASNSNSDSNTTTETSAGVNDNASTNTGTTSTEPATTEAVTEDNSFKTGAYNGSHKKQAMGSELTYTYTMVLNGDSTYIYEVSFVVGGQTYTETENGTYSVDGSTLAFTSSDGTTSTGSYAGNTVTVTRMISTFAFEEATIKLKQ